MRDTIDMAREAGIIDFRDAYSEQHVQAVLQDLKAFEALVRADERNSWPAEMEAMERQVNILTDALAAEREACAKVCETTAPSQINGYECAAAIRARSQA